MKTKLLNWVLIGLMFLMMAATAVAASKSVTLGFGDQLTVKCAMGTVYIAESRYGQWTVACSD